MNEFGEIRKVCGFYVSAVHLVTMMLPYISKQLELGVEYSSLLEFNLKENIELVLSKLILERKAKEKILGINWNASNVYKYSYVEKELKKRINNNKELSVIVSGNNKYITIAKQTGVPRYIISAWKTGKKKLWVPSLESVHHYLESVGY